MKVTEFDMTPDEAAQCLDAELRPNAWYSSIGVGDTDEGPALFVYVRTGRHRALSRLNQGWMGYKVIIRPVGRIQAIA